MQCNVISTMSPARKFNVAKLASSSPVELLALKSHNSIELASLLCQNGFSASLSVGARTVLKYNQHSCLLIRWSYKAQGGPSNFASLSNCTPESVGSMLPFILTSRSATRRGCFSSTLQSPKM